MMQTATRSHSAAAEKGGASVPDRHVDAGGSLTFEQATQLENRVQRFEPEEHSGETIASVLKAICASISLLEKDTTLRQSIIKELYGLDMKQAEDADAYLRGQFQTAAASALPVAPVRDYRPRAENIIEYLKSDDGFGPWWRAGRLTRPLIREMAPKAYTGLANFLRNNDLPDDLPIPTKSETVSAEIADADVVRNARRVLRAAERRSPTA